MDRLEKLAKEKEGYIGNMSPVLPTNFVIPERYQEFIEYENTMLKWLEKQVEQRVAQEIFKELEEIMPMFYRNHIQDYYAIKSRWGIE